MKRHKIIFSKKYFKEQLITKRAKFLYIISYIFQIQIVMPEFEIKARERKRFKEDYYKFFGKAFSDGFHKGLENLEE